MQQMLFFIIKNIGEKKSIYFKRISILFYFPDQFSGGKVSNIFIMI